MLKSIRLTNKQINKTRMQQSLLEHQVSTLLSLAKDYVSLQTLQATGAQITPQVFQYHNQAFQAIQLLFKEAAGHKITLLVRALAQVINAEQHEEAILSYLANEIAAQVGGETSYNDFCRQLGEPIQAFYKYLLQQVIMKDLKNYQLLTCIAKIAIFYWVDNQCFHSIVDELLREFSASPDPEKKRSIFSILKAYLVVVKSITVHEGEEGESPEIGKDKSTLRDNMIVQLFTQSSMVGIFELMQESFLQLLGAPQSSVVAQESLIMATIINQCIKLHKTPLKRVKNELTFETANQAQKDRSSQIFASFCSVSIINQFIEKLINEPYLPLTKNPSELKPGKTLIELLCNMISCTPKDANLEVGYALLTAASILINKGTFLSEKLKIKLISQVTRSVDVISIRLAASQVGNSQVIELLDSWMQHIHLLTNKILSNFDVSEERDKVSFDKVMLIWGRLVDTFEISQAANDLSFWDFIFEQSKTYIIKLLQCIASTDVLENLTQTDEYLSAVLYSNMCRASDFAAFLCSLLQAVQESISQGSTKAGLEGLALLQHAIRRLYTHLVKKVKASLTSSTQGSSSALKDDRLSAMLTLAHVILSQHTYSLPLLQHSPKLALSTFKMLERLAKSLLTQSLPALAQQQLAVALAQRMGMESHNQILVRFLQHALGSLQGENVDGECSKSCLLILRDLTAQNPSANSQEKVIEVRCFQVGAEIIGELIGYLKQQILSSLTNPTRVDHKCQRHMIQSLSKLLCAFDKVTYSNFERSQHENEVILSIYGAFEESMGQIREARGGFSEVQLLSVYRSYLNALRGFFSGIYTANQFEVLIKRFLFNSPSLSTLLSDSVCEFYSSPAISLDSKILLCKSMLGLTQELTQNDMDRFSNTEFLSELNSTFVDYCQTQVLHCLRLVQTLWSQAHPALPSLLKKSITAFVHLGNNAFLTTKQVEGLSHIKHQIQEIASLIMGALYASVRPSLLCVQETAGMQRLVFEYMDKLIRRNVGVFIGMVRGNREMQGFVVSVFAEGLGSSLSNIFYTSTNFVEELYSKSTQKSKYHDAWISELVANCVEPLKQIMKQSLLAVIRRQKTLLQTKLGTAIKLHRILERYYPGSTAELVGMMAREFAVGAEDAARIEAELGGLFAQVNAYSAKKSIYEISDSIVQMLFAVNQM
ncbi:hypothetical protein FGO68_gene3016 [Halteria grandinella]|uniref:Uncharacterized protein n=1 Tax=Halteria grandinella TaxID=5974 RepID=A0A8J8P4F4_HALGN|nr:hypothetical protein FGO68_gene3016 [Halteria grandinella]